MLCCYWFHYIFIIVKLRHLCCLSVELLMICTFHPKAASCAVAPYQLEPTLSLLCSPGKERLIFQVRISRVLRFIHICDLFSDSPSYVFMYVCNVYDFVVNTYLIHSSYILRCRVFFSLLIILQKAGLLGRVISSSQGLYLNTRQHKHRINTYQTSMPCVGLEPTIPASERGKTFHALDRSATVTDFVVILVVISRFRTCFTA
jgi:hypothetical protein